MATIQADYLSDSGGQLLELELAEEVVTAVETGQADAAMADKDFLDSYIINSGGKLTLVGTVAQRTARRGATDRVPEGDA